MGITIVNCKRCAVQCRIGGPANPDAKMLRFSIEGHGLCVNCAVHDFLRNCYPINMMLARSGPAGLLLEHIQKQFAGIMKVAMADATPPEIDWQLIVDNWDLPFADKVKRTATNPVSQQELDDMTGVKEQTFEERRRDITDRQIRDESATAEIIDLIKKGKGNERVRGPDKSLFEK